MSRLLLFVACAGIAACSTAPTVQIDDETLLGYRHPETGVAAFLGVPFAEPPTGSLRWAAPQPLTSKQRQRNATNFASACMQTPRILEWYRDMAEKFGAPRDSYEDLQVSEDCLYLNIWTPSLDSQARLPVMVYVHGGSNKSGWSYETPYHGHVLARDNVVVVSIAYRLGVFGFLSHPELLGESVSANFGLWDQLAALRWIKENIAEFGGDPQRVMMFGESAGAEDILALLFAEPAKRLFHRAALQSNAGFGIEQPTLDDEVQRGMQLAQALQLDGANTLDALRAVPAERLLHAYGEAFSDYYHSPAVDGVLIREPTWQSIKGGAAVDIPVIVGTNADEWLATVGPDATHEDVATKAANLKYIDATIAMQAVEDEPSPSRALDRLFTAEEMLCPSQFAVAEWVEHGGSAWNYFFTRVRDGKAGQEVGAFHGAEYTYIFGTDYVGMPSSRVDRELGSVMRRYWLDFARTGNPNSEATAPWPTFSAKGLVTQELGDVVRTVTRPESALCESFDNYHHRHPAQ